MPLKERIVDELDFGRTISGFLIIFPSDNSIVLLKHL